MNLGAKIASGTYIILLDADAVIDKDYIYNLVSFMESNKEFDAVQSDISVLNGENSEFSKTLSSSWSYLKKSLFEGKYLAGMPIILLGSCSMIRKESLAKIGFWDGNVISDDLDISLKLILNRCKIAYYKNSKGYLEVAETYKVFKKQNERWAYGSFEILKKYFKKIIKSDIPIKQKFDLIFFLIQHQLSLIQLLIIPIALFSLILKRDILPLSYAFSTILITPLIIYLATLIHSSKEEGYGFLKTIRLIGSSTAISTSLIWTIFKSTLLVLFNKPIKWYVSPKGDMAKKIRGPAVLEFLFGLSLVVLSVCSIYMNLFLNAAGPLIFALPHFYVAYKTYKRLW